MPRKKATATKTVRKTATKKKVAKKATKATAKSAKVTSYTQHIDHAYQTAKALVKKQLVALEKENKQLTSQESKLNKAQKATQKAIAALAKKAKAKVQMNKALKAQKANEAALVNNQKALAAVAGQIHNVKNQLAQIISEEQNVIAFRKAKPAAQTAPKANVEKKEKKAKANKTAKAKPAKAKKVKEAVAETTDFADDENQLALVMDEDFLGEDEANNDEDQI